MNMTTSLDSIPMKTSNKNNESLNDDSDDPVVKDILSEFQQELEINTHKQPPLNQKENYNINYQNNDNCYNGNCKLPYSQSSQLSSSQLSNSYYNQEYIKKVIIIVIIVIIIFSPIFIQTLVEKLPYSISSIIESYEFYIKIIILFITLYIIYYYKYL